MRHVAVTGLHKAFGTHPVLTGVDLEVPAGSLTAILGPSGSGKTTLLRLMAGFEQADAGTISIGDALVDGPGVHVAPERRRIGYVPQEGSLFPHLTVEANVGFGLAARERRAGQAAKMLEAVGLGGFGQRYPHQLSGGQQQRDTHLRASIRADVQEIFRRAGTTAVLVTHDQDEALSVADQVAALRDGTIAQCAAPEDLYNRPADPELARFVGDANLLEGVLDGGAVKTLLGDLPLDPKAVPAGQPGQVTVLIRPEQIELDPGQDGMAGQVVSYGYHGHDAVVHVRPAFDADGLTIIVRVGGGRHLPVGSPVTLRARGPVFAWARDQ
jgi:iron(III) transport system ATP-binding protein